MDDIYNVELLRQSLIDAGERESAHLLALQAAEEEMEELRKSTIVYKMKYQELDDTLEVEEGKTNTERLARQEAEETTRQYCAEVLKVKQRETIANKHCDAAESEVVKLQGDLSMERSATVAADLLLCRLREDLSLAEHNETAAYDELEAANARVCTLQEKLWAATNRISTLECRARDLEETVIKEQQRVGELENTLSAAADQLKNSKAQPSDTLEEYIGIETKPNKCDIFKAVAATVFDTNRVGIDEESHINHENGVPLNSKYDFEQIPELVRSIRETMVVKATPSNAMHQMTCPTEMPAFPKPAILRPALASTCQVETFKATGRVLAAPRPNLKNRPWRKYFWKLPPNSIHLRF